MSTATVFDQIFLPERDSGIAIVFEQREISYRELRALTIATAERLNALNLCAGNRVAILLNDSPEFIAAFVAIISLRAIAVPINMALRKPEQRFILNDCGAQVALIEAHTLQSSFDRDAEEAEKPDLPQLKHVLAICREGDQMTSLNSVNVQQFDHATREALPENFPVDGNVDADAFILYTSGSTGEPKGAVHSQADIFYTNDTYCREVLKLRQGDRLFSSSRLPFAYGLGNAFTFPLLNGLTTILCREKPTAEVIARVFRDHRPAIFFAVPVVYRMLLEHHRNVAPLDTASVRFCVSAGEALPAQLGENWQKTFGVEVLDGIGSTEMLHMFMSNRQDDVRYGSSGRLLKGYDAKLVDHGGAPVARGAEGNLWIRGASAASRYWNRPDISARTFVDGWVRTGDLYREDVDGFWWHMGRSDDCFKPTGQWVSPVEVEGVLLTSERIRAAAVVEGFDQDGLSCVCAFVVRANENDAPETVANSLRARCETVLPRFKQPRRYIFVSELPYTATGKVQRFKLREELRRQAHESGAVARP